MTHWKSLTPEDYKYLGSQDFQPGETKILTIKRLVTEMVVGSDGKKSKKVVAYFNEAVKPMILNSTNKKRIQKIFGTPDVETWSGEQICVHTEKVNSFGEIVDALRIQLKKPQDEKYICESCGAEIQGYGSKPAETMAAYTKQKYGKALCSGCATKLAQTINTEVSANENN